MEWGNVNYSQLPEDHVEETEDEVRERFLRMTKIKVKARLIGGTIYLMQSNNLHRCMTLQILPVLTRIQQPCNSNTTQAVFYLALSAYIVILLSIFCSLLSLQVFIITDWPHGCWLQSQQHEEGRNWVTNVYLHCRYKGFFLLEYSGHSQGRTELQVLSRW